VQRIQASCGICDREAGAPGLFSLIEETNNNEEVGMRSVWFYLRRGDGFARGGHTAGHSLE
jgi:hypothetical protein